MKNLALIFLIAIGLVGCAAVQVRNTTFQAPNHQDRGTIAVVPINDDQKNSLEFIAVGARLLEKLLAQGYTLPEPSKKADFVAFLTYGIDDGRTTTSSVPIYGKTGGGTSYTSGTVSGYSGNTANFNATTTSMPTYGVVSSVMASSTEYKRKVNIDIYRVKDENLSKVYEIRGTSEGSCGNLNAIFPFILQAMFEMFPGANGVSNIKKVKWDGKC